MGETDMAVRISNGVFIGTCIAAGGRTGLTSLTTSLLFLASFVLAPVVGIIPSAATAPALIFVGILMLSNVKDVDLNNMEKAMPAFCTIVFMPFTIPSPTASPSVSLPTV